MRKALLFLTVALMATASYAQTSLPWSCDFATNDCSAIYENDAGGSLWVRSTTAGCTSPSMRHSYGSVADVDYVVWGPFTTPTADVVNLAYSLSISDFYLDELTVMYLTGTLYVDPNVTPASWTIVDGPITGVRTCEARYVDLSAVIGSSQFWIAFRYRGNDDNWLLIDNLSLTYSSGPTPTPTVTPTPMAGDTCASALPITFNGAQEMADTSLFTNQYPGHGNDVFYTFTTVEECYSVTFCVSGTGTHDTYLTVLQSDCTTVVGTNDDTECVGDTCNGSPVSTASSSLVVPTLPAGTYIIVAENYGSTSGIVCTKVSGACGTPPTVTPTPPPAGPGDVCANAIAISIPAALPYSAAGATCGLNNDYATTCLGYYDGGADIIYQLDVTVATEVEISFTTTDTWTGILLDDACPPDPTTCIDIATFSGTGGGSMGQNLLAPGTYYIMLDTWPTPDCITAFTLNIAVYVPPTPCVTCPPGATAEGEPVCTTDYVDAYNGGCNSTPNVFQTITCGETICGESGTYLFGTNNYRDTDWFQVTVSEYADLTLTAYGEFPMLVGLASADCALTDIVTGTADYCETATATMIGVAPGNYYAVVLPSVFVDVACGSPYVATLTCTTANTPTPSPTAAPTVIIYSENFEGCMGPGHSLTIVDNMYDDAVSGPSGPDGNTWVCTSIGGGCSSAIGLQIGDVADPVNDWNEDYAVSPVINFDPMLATLYLQFDLTTHVSGAYDSYMVLAYTTDPTADITLQSTWDGTDPSGDFVQNWVAVANTCTTQVVDLSFLCCTGGPGTVRLNFWNESGNSAPDMIDNIVVYQHEAPYCAPTATPTATPAFVLDCPATSQLSQPVNPLDAGFNGYGSDLGSDFLMYDDYTVTDPVCWVKFWGLYTGTADTDFTIEFWTDNAGQPGALTSSYPIVGATPVDTTWTAFGFPLYEYFVELPTCETQLTGWISIVGANNGSTFYWAVNSTATGADCYSYQVSTTTWTPDPTDLAFCLGNAEPPTPTPLPVPASGPFGLGVMIFAISALLGLSVLRKK